MLVRSGALDLIVIDSVAALVPRAEIEGEMGDSHVGLQARLMSQALRKMTGALNGAGTTMIFINQLREKIGVMFGSPETTTGGRALKFYSSVRLDVRRIETLKDGQEMVGNRTRIKVVKNKVAPPFKQAEFDIMYGQGISREGGLIDVGVEAGLVRKAGAWYTYEGDQLGQGKENARTFLRDNPDLANELEKRILEKLGVGPQVDHPEHRRCRTARSRRAHRDRLLSRRPPVSHDRRPSGPSLPGDRAGGVTPGTVHDGVEAWLGGAPRPDDRAGRRRSGGRSRSPSARARRHAGGRRRSRAGRRPRGGGPQDPARPAHRPGPQPPRAGQQARHEGRARRARRPAARPVRGGRPRRRPGVRPGLGAVPPARQGAGPPGAGPGAAPQGRRRRGRPGRARRGRPRRRGAGGPAAGPAQAARRGPPRPDHGACAGSPGCWPARATPPASPSGWSREELDAADHPLDGSGGLEGSGGPEGLDGPDGLDRTGGVDGVDDTLDSGQS